MYLTLAKKHLSTSYIYSIQGLQMTLQPSDHLDQQDFSLVKYYCSTVFFRAWPHLSRWFPWWNTHQKALQEANSNFLGRDHFWQLSSQHSWKFRVPHKALADFASSCNECTESKVSINYKLQQSLKTCLLEASVVWGQPSSSFFQCSF